MVAFGHTAVGALVGLASYHYFGDQNIGLGLVTAGSAGVVSHYVADCIPHGHFFGFKSYKDSVKYVIVFDLFLSVVIFLLFGFLRFGFDVGLFYLLFGIGGSQLPDVVDGFMFLKILPKKGLLKLEHDFHQMTHWHGALDNGLPWGRSDLWQIVVAVFALLALYAKII